jgi:aldehyde dehydrogenase (NAD+)
MEDADLALAAAATAKGAFGSTGQRCTATSRAIVHRSVVDEFIDRMLAAAEEVVPGNGMDPATTMGPSVDAEQFGKVHEYMHIGKAEGAVVACGGGKATAGDLEFGYFTQPTVFTGVHRGMRVAREEIFGPVLSIIAIDSFEEAIAVSNDVEYGLTSSLYTQDIGRVMRYVDQIETGMLHVNSPTIGGEAQLPFGGMKKTGIGPREQGRTAIEFYSEWKTVYIDYTGGMRGGNLY